MAPIYMLTKDSFMEGHDVMPPMREWLGAAPSVVAQATTAKQEVEYELVQFQELRIVETANEAVASARFPCILMNHITSR
jgi:hypothetical protein